MPNEALINTDPIVAQNFFLEIDGSVVTILSSVSGLDIEMEVVTMEQAGANGKVQVVKTLGKAEQGARPVAGPDGAAGHDPGQAVGLVQRHPGQGHPAVRPHATTARAARS